ncbi:hypothetical protein MKZ38_002217 [Zalerion maritima]|uniref:Heavy metal tolerance protein n=1 Tax=Zalerion maritima TaxID=339359 RepID=A0AAD5RP73_9PEZI|nr:hypothetical protein MKZ38_002217 [Zalerion maritima]
MNDPAALLGPPTAQDKMHPLDLNRSVSIIHYAYPTSIFAYYILATSVSICTLQSRTAGKNPRQHPRRRIILILLFLTILSFALQVIALIVDAIAQREWLHSQDTTLSHLSCILVFGIEFALLIDSDQPVWYPYYGSWFLSALFEPAIFVLGRRIDPASPSSSFRIADTSLWSVRYFLLVAVLVCYVASKNSVSSDGADETERQPLIPKDGDRTSANGTAYGTTTQSNDANELPWERGDRKARENMQKKLEDDGNWFTYVKRFKVFFPYIWPVNNPALQARAFLVGACLLAGNALNVLIPRQLGIVMDSLSGVQSHNPWIQVAVFTALKWLASEAGISMLRTWLWMPVEYYSVEAIDTAAYSHILNLSCDFHDAKSASDLIQAISKGESISDMLESVCFYAIPMLIDLGIAFIYLSYTFGPYEGFITLATAVAFLYSTSRLVGGLRESRRNQVNAVYEEHFVRLAGIQGWHTVSQFNQITYEEDRHSNAVKKKVSTYKSFAFRFYLSRAVQYVVLLIGLLAGSFLAVYRVLNNQATAGEFVMLLTYWSQLSSPLDFFAGLWKKLAQNLVNAERLLEIMETKPSILSKDGAMPLNLRGGSVKFSNVCFTYDKKKDILKNVSLEVPKGQTVAFVGATGAGKSTILKLLTRFYDVTDGAILIDDQDVRDVELSRYVNFLNPEPESEMLNGGSSLRARLGVVPQSPILFNDTVINNIRYARLSATDEEVFEACKAACIHDQIQGFSDQYKTVVGERGVKLSGGELQRVAIARAILKKPEIVLLDEATSAVDTETEQKIQNALKILCRGRTTFIVAHRLSTVVNADRIIVVGDGTIVEQGSHDDLIRAKGKYAALWSKQIFVKPKDKKGGQESGDSTETDMVDDLSLEQAKELAHAIKGGNDTDTSSRSDKKSKSKSRKNGCSKLNPGAPEFTPNTLSCASTVQDETSPVEPETTSGVPSPTGDQALKHFTVARATNYIGDSNSRAIAYADGAADDERDSCEDESCDKIGSAIGKSKYKHPRYSRVVQSKSESGVEWSGSPYSQPISSSPSRRVSAPPLKVDTGIAPTNSNVDRDDNQNECVDAQSRESNARDYEGTR